MTVKQLKEKLNQFDDDLIVVAADYDEDDADGNQVFTHLHGAEVLSDGRSSRLVLFNDPRAIEP